MPAIQNITASTILAGPGNNFTKTYDSQETYVPNFVLDNYSNTSSSSSTSSKNYEVHHGGIYATIPSPIERPQKDGLGLPKTSRPLPPIPIPYRPVSAPLIKLTEMERLRLRRSSVAALIGLGIYVPTVQQQNEVVENDVPLLPTRRSSPTHITTILDDDINPPVHSIFTPEITRPSTPPPNPRFFYEAPPAEDLPTPRFYSPGEPAPTIQPAQPEPITTENSLRTPFVFQPFSPIAEDPNPILTTSYAGLGLDITINVNDIETPAIIPPPSFYPPVIDLFNPSGASTLPPTPPVAPIEPAFHLPTDLLNTPQADDIILDSPFAAFLLMNEIRNRRVQLERQLHTGAGLGFRGIIYETSPSNFA